MHADGVGEVAGVVALIAEAGAGGHEVLGGAGWKGGADEGAALGVGQVGVVVPDLARGLERVLGHTDDDGALPVEKAREVAVVSGHDRGLAEASRAEDIEALVVLAWTPRVA